MDTHNYDVQIYIILMFHIITFFFISYIKYSNITREIGRDSMRKNINVQKNGWVETDHSLTHHYFRHMTRLFSSFLQGEEVLS